jgi:hypothetical protein
MKRKGKKYANLDFPRKEEMDDWNPVLDTGQMTTYGVRGTFPINFIKKSPIMGSGLFRPLVLIDWHCTPFL